MSLSHWFKHRQRNSMRFWGILVVLCLLAALATLGVKTLFTSVGSAKHTRYEPVDVPPREVSPRHQKEREEYERRDRVSTEQGR
jgi:hypothetical protein